MGKTGGGGSWLTAVKRAFRSPTKNEKSNTRRREELQEHEEEEKVDNLLLPTLLKSTFLTTREICELLSLLGCFCRREESADGFSGSL